MINKILLVDTINIYQDTIIKSSIAKKSGCSEIIHSNIPALIGCGKAELEKPSCSIEKNLKRKMCIEIAPGTLSCNNKRLIVEVIRNGCNLGKFRVEEVIPNITVVQGHYSDKIIAYSL